MSTGADTRGGGALEMRDSRLFEDGREREGALVSDAVAVETAGEGRGEDREKAVVSRGAGATANTLRDGAQQLSDLRLVEHGGERGGALVSDLVKAETANEEQRTGMLWKSKRVNGR